MRVGFGGALLAIAGLSLSLLTGSALAESVADLPRDLREVSVEPQKLEFLPHCQTPQSMNCIESIEYKLDDEWQTAILIVGREIISDDGNGNIVYGNPYYEYETPGLIHEGGRTSVKAMLIERDDINGPPYAAYQTTIQAWPQSRTVLWDPPINRCDNGDPRFPGNDPCWRAPWLADTDYRFTFRTSTLIPVFAQSSVVGMSTSTTEVPRGLRVSVAGRPGPSQWALNSQVAKKNDQFDAVTYEWDGFLSDIRARNGALAECQGLGMATAYSNGNGGQIPEWSPQTGTLTFGTAGFHYDQDGRVYRGRAEVFVPGPLARCMWKVDPRQTARMSVEVFSDDGNEVAGTKSIAYDARADLVRMIAVDFTFSEKQIVARPTPVEIKPGKRACNAQKTMCVTVDRARKTAKVTLTKVRGSKEVTAVVMRGTREDGGSQVNASVKKGKASFALRLQGSKSKDEFWVLRTRSTYISSFQVK